MFNIGRNKKNLNYYRKLIQILGFLFLFFPPLFTLLDYREIIGNYYSLSFWGFEISDPSMAIQNFLISGEFFIPIIISILIPVVISVIFGKVFCSWLCPYNALHDFFAFISARIKKQKYQKTNNRNPKPSLYWIVFIGILSLVLFFSIPLVTLLSAPGIISNNIYYLLFGISLSTELTLILTILLIELVSAKRIWCKYACPVGATLSLFKTPISMQIQYDQNNCNCTGDIHPCNNVCPLNLNPKEKNLYPFCFNCGKCVKICEKTGNKAIRFKFLSNK